MPQKKSSPYSKFFFISLVLAVTLLVVMSFFFFSPDTSSTIKEYFSPSRSSIEINPQSSDAAGTLCPSIEKTGEGTGEGTGRFADAAREAAIEAAKEKAQTNCLETLENAQCSSNCPINGVSRSITAEAKITSLTHTYASGGSGTSATCTTVTFTPQPSAPGGTEETGTVIQRGLCGMTDPKTGQQITPPEGWTATADGEASCKKPCTALGIPTRTN